MLHTQLPSSTKSPLLAPLHRLQAPACCMLHLPKMHMLQSALPKCTFPHKNAFHIAIDVYSMLLELPRGSRGVAGRSPSARLSHAA